MPSSVRDQVRALLQPLITGNGWSVKPHTVKAIGNLARPTVFIEHTLIEQLAAAPIGHLSNTVVVTVVDHHADYDQAEDGLDAKVTNLLTALDAHDRLNWQRAEKVAIKDTYLGWAITLTLITEPEE